MRGLARAVAQWSTAAWMHGRRLWPATLLLACAGCAANYEDVMRQVNQDLVAQQPQAALKSLDKLQGGHDQALYLLNKAMVLRMEGDYAGSIQAFEQVKPLVLYLEATSVTETTAALTLTEGARSYEAPLYERLLVHVYQGLNYLQTGQPDQARVEATQADDLLKRLYPNTDASPVGGDAFPRYFSGLIYEDLGEYSDAMISYRQAYQAYKAQGDSDAAIPPDLKLSLCRFADFLGLTDELNGYKERFGISEWPPVQKQDDQGQVIFVFGDGLGPVKIAQTAMLPNPANGHYYSVTLPVLRRRPPGIQAAEVTASDVTARTERMASIAADASQQMAADRPKLLAAEFSRNVVRSAAANQADKKAQGLGSLVSLVASAVDQADVRTWGTLPDNIQVARLRLPPGTYDLTVRFIGSGGAPRVIKNVQVQAGQMTFESLQWTYLN